MSAFNKLMGMPDVSRPVSGGYAHELLHPGIRSAIEITGQLPELYDLLYTEIPSAYNKAGGSFGKITAVKMFDLEKAGDKNPKYLRQKPQTPFFKKEVNYTCPDGFIIPLLYGLRTIMQERDGLLIWRTDPKLFLNRLLPEVMKSYRLAIEMAQWDPQKVGKNISTYDFAESAVAATLARSGL